MLPRRPPSYWSPTVRGSGVPTSRANPSATCPTPAASSPSASDWQPLPRRAIPDLSSTCPPRWTRSNRGLNVITNLTFFKRRPGLSVDAFRSYWQTTHRDLALQLPGLRRYVQHPTDDSGYRRHEPVYDGVAETLWNDLDDLRQLKGRVELSNILAD